ncbi:Transmembrane protein 198 [Acipenser ruthenus]|uniref:Transmembrane protein 198 n=1 Tax=Acipenser ruthenus TaxID=7906 RepID=A0A444V0U6_ACIRT|nr:Transmembrane protein 198 [Acipenser ruthenus]
MTSEPLQIDLGVAGEGVTEVDVCELEIQRDYEIIPAIICTMCCLFGVIYCFFVIISCCFGERGFQCLHSLPSYLQSLRDRQMGTGTSLSSLSTNTHTMVDLDYECGSTVPLTATTPVVRV